MRFQINDRLVHTQHGLGRVTNLEMKQFGQGEKQEYYEIAITSGTIWVPVEGSSSGLRNITTKGDLDRYRSLLRARPTPLAPNYKERHLSLVERLKESSFQATCEVVRDLIAYSWTKPLNESTSTLLRRTHQLLCAEWAAAEGQTLSKATHEVDTLLLEGKKTHGN
jgi:RNA polymerase-interacting CarD/CdnL/TRCF family regulator